MSTKNFFGIISLFVPIVTPSVSVILVNIGITFCKLCHFFFSECMFFLLNSFLNEYILQLKKLHLYRIIMLSSNQCRQMVLQSKKLKKMELQILDTLLKFPKKKQIKKLFEHCLVLTNQQSNVSENFNTPIIQSLHSEIGLSSVEVHKLILSITNLFKVSALVNFDEERLNNILGDKLQDQLKQLVVGILLSFADQMRQNQLNRVRQGKHLDIDSMDWNLASEIGNEKGKSNTPIVEITLPLEDSNRSGSQRLKFQMKGQQFEVFFKNLTKIKQTLTDLVSEG